MSESEKNAATKTGLTVSLTDQRPDNVTRIAAPASVKDSGKVHIGGGMMRFRVKDSGRVHIGGGMMRF